MLSRLTPKLLPILLLVYMTASLIHFVHNAEFLAEYPNLPTAWTRSGVYLAWIGMTVVGLAGWTLLSLGYRLFGLLLLAVYAGLGLDSLGHYVVAPFSAHTEIMNSTILLEVIAAALVLMTVLQQFKQQVLSQAPDDIS
ncbi:MAG: hypothetical protein AAGI69_05955 [Cyanobacteria bacterium P01_H01_bin.21]